VPIPAPELALNAVSSLQTASQAGGFCANIRMYEYRKINAFLFLLILIDQLSKYIIRTSGGFYICNKGIAFGLNFFWIAFILLLIIILFVIHQITKSKFPISNKIPKPKCLIRNLSIRHFIRNWKLEIGNRLWIILPVSLIVTGGVSNLIDRLHYGCVTDFIDLKIWPVFNLADIYITIGAIIIMKHIACNMQHATKKS